MSEAVKVCAECRWCRVTKGGWWRAVKHMCSHPFMVDKIDGHARDCYTLRAYDWPGYCTPKGKHWEAK